jgi:hypothetical protein
MSLRVASSPNPWSTLQVCHLGNTTGTNKQLAYKDEWIFNFGVAFPRNVYNIQKHWTLARSFAVAPITKDKAIATRHVYVFGQSSPACHSFFFGMHEQ